jgi:hypothetical protein
MVTRLNTTNRCNRCEMTGRFCHRSHSTKLCQCAYMTISVAFVWHNCIRRRYIAWYWKRVIKQSTEENCIWTITKGSRWLFKMLKRMWRSTYPNKAMSKCIQDRPTPSLPLNNIWPSSLINSDKLLRHKPQTTLHKVAQTVLITYPSNDHWFNTKAFWLYNFT